MGNATSSCKLTEPIITQPIQKANEPVIIQPVQKANEPVIIQPIQKANEPVIIKKVTQNVNVQKVKLGDFMNE